MLNGADLLNIHRKLVPMTILQIKSIVKKSIKDIKILIITNQNELIKAQKLQSLFPNKIKKFTLQTQIVQESDIDKLYNYNFDAIYCFSLEQASYDTIKNISLKKNIVTFTNRFGGLKNGLLVYISKKKKIKIWINSQTMRKVKIPFSSKFLSVVKMYDE
jgi:Asp-tRNA(Asn)/Glu-tRNA(Gln) amidotransferase A subunit family amidase